MGALEKQRQLKETKSSQKEHRHGVLRKPTSTPNDAGACVPGSKNPFQSPGKKQLCVRTLLKQLPSRLLGPSTEQSVDH